MKSIYKLFGIPLLLFIFSGFGYGQCDIAVTMSSGSQNWGDNTNWRLEDSDGVAVLTGGTYGMNYNDVQNHVAVNPPYTLIITVNANTWCDNDGNYLVTVGGVTDLSGNQASIECGGELVLPLNTDLTECIPSCFALNATVSLFGLSGAELTWTSPENSEQVTIEWSTSDFTPGEGQEEGSTISTEDSETFEDLEAGETYFFYLQNDCGVDDGLSSWAGPFTVFVPGPGDQCETAIEVTSLPYFDEGTTADYTDFYSGAPGASCGVTSSYLNGDDVVYAYTADFSGLLNVQMNPTATWSGIFVYEDCADIGVKCIAGEGNSTSNLREFDLDVEDGKTYYFVISTFATPQSTGYTFSLSSCFAPSDLQVTSNLTTSVTLEWQDENGGTSWGVLYGESGFDTQTEGETIIVDETNATIEDLIEGQEYEFYVYSICNEDNQSNLAGPVIKAVSYCVPLTTSTLDYITEFSTTNAVDNITHSVGAYPTNPNGYLDLVNDFTISQAPGASFDFSTTFTDASNAVRIWVDWNKNFEFEDDEIVFQLAGAGAATKTGTIEIPSDIEPGDYRIRVRTRFGTGTFPGACDVFSFGSAHDYTLEVLGCEFAAVTGINADNITSDAATITWNQGLASAWNVEYGPSGFVQGEGTVIEDVDVNMVEISGLDFDSEYDVYVQAICEDDVTSPWSAPTSFTTTVLCPTPSNLSAENIVDESADLTWSENGFATTWNIEWGEGTFAQGEGDNIESGVTTNPFTLTGLTESTTYSYFVQADCGDGEESEWAGPFTFTTDLTKISQLPFLETFEENSSTRDFWTQVQEAGNGNWTYATGSSGGSITTAFEGDLNARFVSQLGTNSPRTVLVSPVFDLSAETELELAFYYGQESWGADQNELKVYYRLDVTEPWIELEHYTENVGSWKLGTIILTEFSDNFQIAFEGINNFGRANVLDNINIQRCPRPLDVMVDNIAATSAEISWTENGDATTWNIEYGPVGFTPGSGTLIEGVDEIPYLLTGLTQETSYEVRVQADCGAEQSAWSEGVVFETLLSCPVVSGINFTNVTATSFDVNWTAGGDELSYIVELIEQGGTPTGSGVTVTGTSTSFEDLDPETDYTVIVTSVCEDEITSPNITGNVTTLPTCLAPTSFVSSNVTATSVDLAWTNNSTSDDFIIEFGETGFTLGTGETVSGTGTSITIEDLDPETDYSFYVYSDCGDDDLSAPAGPRDITTPPTCPGPTDLVASNPTAFTVDLAWTNNSTSDDFIVEYGEAGFTLGSGETVTGSGTSVTIEDLDPETAYSFYVYSDCGDDDVSAVSNVANATTVETCPAPTAVTVTEITQNSALVSWTSNGEETEWSIEYGPAGFEQGEGEVVDGIEETEFLLEGLENTTAYDVYVIAVCAEDDLSLSASASFDTEIGCGGTFYDNGGPEGDYLPNSNEVYVICPENEGDYVTVTFNSFHTETNWDGIYVFDGDDITAPMIASDNAAGFGPMTQPGAYWGTDIPGPFEPSEDNETGCITIQFLSDGFVQFAGFEATVSCAPCSPEPVADVSEQVCRLDDVVNLLELTGLTEEEVAGTFTLPLLPIALDGFDVNVGAMPAGTYEIFYTVNTPCVDDTTVITLEVFPPSSAGDNGSIDVCRNEPVNLFDGLLGNIDLGGTWFTPTGQSLPNSVFISPNIPGSYNYDYVVSNGICPADTQFVEVIVGQCDYLNVKEQEMGEIAVYPNPASDVINVTNGTTFDNLNIEIHDVNGRLVYAQANALNSSDNATVSIAHLEKGIYTVRVFGAESQRTFKVVKH